MEKMDGIRVTLELERRQSATGQTTRLYGMVALEAPRFVPEHRPPLDIVACIDTSGSMAGRKLAEARRAVQLLAQNLTDEDRLALVAFSSEAVVVSPLVRTDRGGRDELCARAEQLREDGNTNMSDGTRASLRLLQGDVRLENGKEVLRRAMVFTDGHANQGIAENDRRGWTQLLKENLGDASVSWFGFGEDHDPHFLSALADESRGNAYVAKDADAIGTAFAQELGSLVGTVAKDLRVRIRTDGQHASLLNDEAHQRDGADAILVTIPDLTSEEKRTLVFEWELAPGPLEARRRVDVDVSWFDVRSQATDAVTLGDSVTFVLPGAVDRPSTRVLEAAALQRAAVAQKQAAELVERGDMDRARQILDAAFAFAAGIGTPAADRLASRLRDLAREYADRAHYFAHRSDLKSVQRGFSKSRTSGSRFDHEALNDLQVHYMAAFRVPPPPPSTPGPSTGTAPAPVPSVPPAPLATKAPRRSRAPKPNTTASAGQAPAAEMGKGKAHPKTKNSP